MEPDPARPSGPEDAENWRDRLAVRARRRERVRVLAVAGLCLASFALGRFTAAPPTTSERIIQRDDTVLWIRDPSAEAWLYDLRHPEQGWRRIEPPPRVQDKRD